MPNSPRLRGERRVRRCNLTVNVAGLTTKLFIYQWTSVLEIKHQIARLFAVPVNQQRLFHGHIEMANSRLLDEYYIFDQDHNNKEILVEFKAQNDSHIRICPGSSVSISLVELVTELNHGLALGLAPSLTMEGTGGTYFLRNAHRKIRAVFKPLNEEPFTPFNPREYIGKLGHSGFRNGVFSGEAGYREVAAYLLDHGNFSGVPHSTIVEAQHDTFSYGPSHHRAVTPKKGSLQEYINSKGCIENFSNSIISKEEIHRIAILDIRILNMDRNEGNILVLDNYKLVPIDHGLSIPDCFEISEYDLCWMSWVHSKQPLSELCFEYIENIDPIKDISLLKDTMPFRDKCLRNIRISGILLKKGVEAGLSLYHIGSMLFRKGYSDQPSVVELSLQKAIEMYKTVNQTLSSRLLLENSLSNTKRTPVKQRSRSYSTNEGYFDTFMRASSPLSQSSVSGKLELSPYETVMTIAEISSEDKESDEEGDYMPLKEINGRSLSLPSLRPLEDHKRSIIKEETQAFDQKLFYYIEAFINQSIQQKLKEIRSNFKLDNETPEGRNRSCSNAIAY